MNNTIIYVCFIRRLYKCPVMNIVKLKGFVVEWGELKYMFIAFIMFKNNVLYFL